MIFFFFAFFLEVDQEMRVQFKMNRPMKFAQGSKVELPLTLFDDFFVCALINVYM